MKEKKLLPIAQLDRGFTTFCIKPSQFIDDSRDPAATKAAASMANSALGVPPAGRTIDGGVAAGAVSWAMVG